MLDQKTKSATSVFSAGILTTFGKLSQQEIDTIDGHPERLVIQLIEQYGWERDVAQKEVKNLQARLSTASGNTGTTSNNSH